ncbi:uncharacterized protein LOC106882675 [Octopus bimaculoides]|uniref:Uncharacterized protein n=1 Tax=Octopus bimaculoides TaxID=37653 RepID=A0A0L8I7J3_OCTBM|nr:uncharacterized protein LOC106882675 [Octopus bimaculoides]|eukprot:XP_014788924.1 PREDICTED: uncharacterized protein LOC106882675 [Octopus bimaculoides]
MTIGAAFTVTILLVIMAEANGYFLLKDVVKFTKVAGELQTEGYIVDKPAYSSSEPVIDTSNISWENFDNCDLYTKLSIAAAERTANKTNDADNIVESIMQNPLLVSDHVAPLERVDKFIPEKRGWFDFLKSKINHLQDIKVWLKKVVNKNVFLKKFGDDFPKKFAKLSLYRLKYLKSICENQVDGAEDERLMDFKILDMPAKTNERVHLHVYKMKVWVDCESSTNMGGLTYEYTKYSFKARNALIDRMSSTAINRGVEALKCFLKKVVGPEPFRNATTTQKPATTTTIKTTAAATPANGIKPTMNIHLVGDCEQQENE